MFLPISDVSAAALVGSELAAISHELQGISVVPVGPSWNRRGMMQTDGRFDHF
jgi:hypothetical protein